MLKYSRNVKLVVETSLEVSKRIGLRDLIEMFEQNNSYEGVYHLLVGGYETSKDAVVFQKFIESCVRLNQTQELEKAVKAGFDVYDSKLVLDLLLGAQL